MRVSLVVSVVTVASFVGALYAVSPSRDEGVRLERGPETVNEVIGDQSFVETYGRPPTEADDNELRVRTHLAYVEKLLRSVDDSALAPELRARRRMNLDLLRSYWQAGLFPAGENPSHRQPTFIDDAGRRCAVAYLVEASAGADTVNRINGRFRNANIREMNDPALAAWIAGSGLTRREVMTIQPTYDFRHRPWEMTRWQLITDTSAFYLNRVAGDDVDGARRIAGVDLKAQLIDLQYQWLAGAEGAVGSTLSGGTFYRFGLRTGGVPVSDRRYQSTHLVLLATVGAEVDGIVDVVPLGVTVPAGLLLSFDTLATRLSYEDNHHQRVPWPIVQLRGEGGWVAWGRPERVAWTGGLDLVWRISVWKYDEFRFRDLIARLTVTELAGTVYGGVAIGVGSWSRTELAGEGRRPDALPPLLGPYW